ncbi:MAG: YggU family protein [Lentisphaerae bacterium]|nr:YggU family protein [Lentisphaerota bacterium]
MSWLIQSDKGVIIQTHIVPGSASDVIAGIHGDALKIKIKAPPEAGRANKALIKFIAQKTGVVRSNIELISGTTSRQKKLLISNISEEQVRASIRF